MCTRGFGPLCFLFSVSVRFWAFAYLLRIIPQRLCFVNTITENPGV
jgi:hypothetical protein